MTTQAVSIRRPSRGWVKWAAVADPLLAIEYGFHVSLMIVGGIPAAFFMKVVGKRA